MRGLVRALVLCAALPLAGCIGIFAEDGSSVSVGTSSGGALLHGVALPAEGTGYRVPGPWQARGRQFGTEEVVRWLTGAFRKVEEQLPDSLAALGDISRFGGGRSLEHRSHGSGRDVDVFFYAVDLDGRPYHPTRAMLRFAPDGSAKSWSPPERDEKIDDPIPVVRFDVHRNWALVKALLSDPTVDVQWIFIHKALAELMLREGPEPTDDPALVARAAAVLHQPSDSQPHDDHMHIRVYCATGDRALGCLDHVVPVAAKKHGKYFARAPFSRVRAVHRRPISVRS